MCQRSRSRSDCGGYVCGHMVTSKLQLYRSPQTQSLKKVCLGGGLGSNSGWLRVQSIKVYKKRKAINNSLFAQFL